MQDTEPSARLSRISLPTQGREGETLKTEEPGETTDVTSVASGDPELGLLPGNVVRNPAGGAAPEGAQQHLFGETGAV